MLIENDVNREGTHHHASNFTLSVFDLLCGCFLYYYPCHL